MAKDEEKPRLDAWGRYNVQLSCINPEDVPEITSP
ncbi:tail fiber assembly protein [Serratia fonticola]